MGKWQALPSMPEVLNHVDSIEIAFRGCLFVCGGIDGGEDGLANIAQASFGRYCPRVNHWEVLASMPVGLSHPGVTAFAGHIYVCGGCENLVDGKVVGEKPSDCMLRFRPDTGLWESLTPIPRGIDHPGL